MKQLKETAIAIVIFVGWVAITIGLAYALGGL